VANIIKIKRGSGEPGTSDLAYYELGYRTGTEELYINDGGTIRQVGSGSSGGGAVDSIANFADNRLLTASDADSINGEANLLFSGSTLEINNTGDWSYILNNTNSGGLRFGSKDSGGTLAYQIEISNTGNYVKLNEDVQLPATKKLYLDGGGDTYLHEDSADSVYMVVGGVNVMRFYETSSAGYAYAPDNFYVGVGNGIDFTMRHDGNNSYLKNTTGNLHIRGRDDGYVTIDSNDGTESIVCDLKSEVKIKHAGTTVFETNSSGFQMPATKKFYLDGGNNTYFTETASDLVDMYVGGVLMMRFEESGTDSVFTNDNVRLGVGVHKDLVMYHDGSHSYIDQTGTGHLHIRNTTDDKHIIISTDDGSGGVDEYMKFKGDENLIRTLKNFRLHDSCQLQLGTSAEMDILHDGSNATIRNGVGSLLIEQQTDDGDLILKSDNGSGGTTAYITLDGSIVRTVFDKATRHKDSVQAYFGNSDDLKIVHDGNNSIIQADGTGDLTIRQDTADKDILLRCDDGSGGIATYITLDGSATKTTFNQNARVVDSKRIGFGNADDLQIKHDGINSYIDNDTGMLFIRNTLSNQDIRFTVNDGGVTSNLLTLNSASSRVGINTTAPSDRLHIYESGNATVRIQGAGGQANIRYQNDAQSWYAGITAAEQFYWYSSELGATTNMIHTNGDFYTYYDFLISNNNRALEGRETGGTIRSLIKLNSSNQVEIGSNPELVLKTGGGGRYVISSAGAHNIYGTLATNSDVTVGNKHNPTLSIMNTATGAGSGPTLEFGHNQGGGLRAAAINTYLTDGSTTNRTSLLKFHHTQANADVLKLQLGDNYVRQYQKGDTSDYLETMVHDTHAEFHVAHGNYIKVSTDSGYALFGPQNSSWNHIYTNAAGHLFDKYVTALDGNFQSYSNVDLSLRRSQGSADRFDITADYSRIIVNNTERFRATTSGATVTGNLAVTGTVDGRDVATDGTKLDGLQNDAIISNTGDPGDSRLQYWQTNNNTTLNPDTSWYTAIRMGHGDPVTYYSNTLAIKMTGTGSGTIYTRNTAGGTAGNWNKHWHDNNDGSGSGLDADTVDGVQATNFVRKGNTAENNTSNRTTFNSENAIESSSGHQSSLEVYNSSAGNDAFMQFHVSSDYALYFGLDGSTNDLAVGGWSMGANKYKIWHAGNTGSFTGDLVSSERNKGVFGTYDSTKTDHIWSMGTAYRNHASGTDFGNLYGLAYKHTNNSTGGNMGGGHQMVWCTNGVPRGSIGEVSIWSKNYFYAAGNYGASWDTNRNTALTFAATLASTAYNVLRVDTDNGFKLQTLGGTGGTQRWYTSGSNYIQFSGTTITASLSGTATSANNLRDSSNNLVRIDGSNELNFYNSSGSAAALYINHHDSNSEVNIAYSGAQIGASYGVRVPDGSATTPTHSFNSDTNTGMYRLGDDDLGFTAGGSLKYGILNGLNRFYSNVVVGPNNNNSKPYIQYKDGYDTASTPSYSWYYDNGCGMGHPAGSTIAFSTGSSERVRITNSGLQVHGDIDANKIYIAHGGSDYSPNISFLGSSDTPGSNTYENAIIGYYDAGGTGNMLLKGNRAAMNWHFNDSDETLFLMASSGDFHAHQDVVAYSTSAASDKKFKENIKTIPYGLEEVLQMNPVEYDWKEKRNKAHDIGVIAQEIEKIIPEVVKESKELNSDETFKSVDYGKMVAVLIKAVQEQQVQIDELKTQIGE
jgi:hypothetical protein